MLAEWGDKTQLLVAALALRYPRVFPILLGVAAAAVANAAIASVGGALVHSMITPRATALLVALSLLFAGGASLFRPKPPETIARWKTGAFLTAAAGCFLLEFGDKTQFTTFAISAQFGTPALAAAGASAGVLAAATPAVLLADRLTKTLPVRAIRIGSALLFLLAGFIVAINALRLT